MTIPGFTADRALYQTRRFSNSKRKKADSLGVQPALAAIYVDGQYYCDGVVTEDGVQCYGGSSGPRPDPANDPRIIAACRRACLGRCHNKINSTCYRDCIGDC